MNDIRYVDTFSGVGGLRLGLEKASPRYKCVWSCDNDKYANYIYTRRFPNSLHYPDDIRGVDPKEIPDFDLLCAGFPCQPFSVAGERLGLEDTRGTLFFEICRIALAKRPSWLLLENVTGLLSHDEGLTFQIILESLDELGYWCEWEVLNSLHFGVPQNRERVFIIGHSGERCRREVFPIPKADSLADGETNGRGEYSTSIDRSYYKGPDKHGQRTLVAVEVGHRGANMNEGRFSEYSHALDGTSSKGVIQLNQRRELNLKEISGAIHQSMGNNQAPKVITPRHGSIDEDYSPALTKCMVKDHPKVLDPRQSRREDEGLREFSDVSPSLTRTMHKEPPVVMHRMMETAGELRTYDSFSPTLPTGAGGGHIPEWILDNYLMRKFTPVECERLQGFPDNWTEGVSDTRRYMALGNAMTVNVLQYLGERMMETIFNES